MDGLMKKFKFKFKNRCDTRTPRLLTTDFVIVIVIVVVVVASLQMRRTVDSQAS